LQLSHSKFKDACYIFLAQSRGKTRAVGLVKGALSVFSKLGMILAIAAAFFIGLLGTLYWSFQSSEVQVPSVVGKSSTEGEALLGESGLNMRRRAFRYNPDVPANTILEQTPKPGETVKAGQFIAVVLSRPVANEGETSVPVAGQGQNANTDSTNTQPSGNENANNANANSNTNRNRNRNANSNRNKNSNNSNANNANNRNGNANNRNAGNTSGKNTNNANGRNTNNANNRNANNRNSSSVPGNPRSNSNRPDNRNQ
jgi:beta-lactam-binding protein with PASTA domain